MGMVETCGGGTVWNAMTTTRNSTGFISAPATGAMEPEDPQSRRRRQLVPLLIVALDADTGEYVWHYQVNPGETGISMPRWTSSWRPRDSRQTRQVILHARNGFFYVIDRETGKLISAEKFARVTWAERIDLARDGLSRIRMRAIQR